MYTSLTATVYQVISPKLVEAKKDTKSIRSWLADNHYDSSPTAGSGMIHNISTTSAKHSNTQHAKFSNALKSAGYSKKYEFQGEGTNNTSWKHPNLNSVHTSYSTEGQKHTDRHGVSITTSD